MIKVFFLLFLFISSLFSKNLIDLSFDTREQTHTDYLFNELMKDYNTSDSYSQLTKTTGTSYISINTNFNDMIGLNYSISMASSNYDYESKEIYLGTSKIKYIAINDNEEDISYSSNTLHKSSNDLTILGVITYKKESSKSSKKEKITPSKYNALTSDAQNGLPADYTPLVHRNFNLEKFTFSTENLYDVTKEDANNNKSYLLPIMFSKKYNDNISFYGVAILGYTQENYQDIENYFVDSNGTKQNLTYSTKLEDGVLLLNKEAASISQNKTFDAKYDGFEYGYKLTAQYKLKDINFYITAYRKTTKLKNKYKKDLSQTYVNSALDNTVTYEKLTYTQKYINFGVRYRF